MFELLIVLLIGVFLGTCTGLIPGIHTNLVAIFLVSSSAFFLEIFTPIQLIVLIVSMGLTNTFVNTMPSIYLGAPDSDTALSVLPGHRMLLEGKGHEAIFYTLVGSAIAVFLFIIIAPIFFFTIPYTQNFIEKMMAFFLVWACIFLIGREESRIPAIIIFFLAGFLGIASMNLNLNQPLLPLLTGLFGTSTLIYSISNNSKVPPQNLEKIKIKFQELKSPTFATALVSPICSFLPGMGASQSAIIGSQLMKKSEPKSFLILVGSTDTLVLAMSFLILYLTNKTRTGLAGAISALTSITMNDLLIISGTMIVTTFLAIYVTLKLSKSFAKIIDKVNYEKVSKIVIIFLVFIVTIISGFKGLLVLGSATILGLTCAHMNVRKGFLMGCLMIPAILFYLPF